MRQLPHLMISLSATSSGEQLCLHLKERGGGGREGGERERERDRQGDRGEREREIDRQTDKREGRPD